MVTSQSTTIEGKNVGGDAAKESMVLSRIRMLDARLAGGDKTSPSAAYTRKNVHPFNRTLNYNNSKSQLVNTQKDKIISSDGPESRDSESSTRPSQTSSRETVLSRASPPKGASRYNPTINTDHNHLSTIRNYPPLGERGSPLRRDDTAHTFNIKTSTPNTVENKRYTTSPIKPIRSASPSSNQNKHTKSLQDNDNTLSNDLQNLKSEPDSVSTSPGFNESPVKKDLHPLNKLQSMEENRPKTDRLLDSNDDPKSQIIGGKAPNKEKSKIPPRVALHFGRGDVHVHTKNQQDDSTTKDAVSKDNDQGHNSQNRALSPGGSRLILQRHYWDREKSVSAGNSKDKNAAGASHISTGVQPSVVVDTGSSTVKAKDPSPRNANQRLLKPEPEASITYNNSLQFQTKIQREYRKIPASPKRRTNQNPPVKKDNSELERNLNAASAVMTEEKASSVGSSSSSARSGLSHEELGDIAAQALKLSQLKEKRKHDASPLQQIMSTKRISNNSQREIRGGGGSSSIVTGSDFTMPYSYSSAQRLSERLTRAERFTALKNAKHAGRSGLPSPSSTAPTENHAHPVFGYSKQSIAISTSLASDSAPTLSPEPSCVRRSKHLSKALQHKAHHFASASPTRRAKAATEGFANSPKIHQKKMEYRSHESNFRPDQKSRYDPLGLHVDNTSYQNHHDYIRTDPYSVGAKIESREIPHAPGYGNAASANKANPAYPSNALLTGSMGFATKEVRQNYGGVKLSSLPMNDRSTVPSKPKGLTPGQQLEILAREQRSKFEEEQNRYRNQQQHITMNKVYDDSTNYSFDGISSVDGDILYEEPAPVVSRRTTSESKFEAKISRNDPQHFRSVTNNHPQANFHGHKISTSNPQQSHRQTTQRPDPSPLTHEALVSPATGCDNTFTGSLNKPVKATTTKTSAENTIGTSVNQNNGLTGNDSSDSSADKPDAFRWLHQKYGNAPTVPEISTQKIASLMPISINTKENIGNNDNGNDEDDVFFGLDETNSEEEKKLPEPKQSTKLNLETSDVYVNSRQQFVESPNGYEIEKEKKKISKGAVKQSNEKYVDNHISIEQFPNSKAQSDDNDISTNLSSDREQQTRRRPTPLETEAHPSHSANVSLEQDYTDGDDESEQDENKPPPTSVLKNLGSVIVKSIQRACAIPEELPNIAACAINTKMKCEEKMSEAWVGLGSDENVTHGDASRTSKTTDTGGVLNENDIGATTNENDDRSETSVSSRNSQSNVHFRELREIAQNRLLHHAETAMALFGNNKPPDFDYVNADKFEQKPTISTDSSTTHGPQPLPNEATIISPTSRISESKSVDQRMVLQTFSTCLKKGGVEVLKLSRWNIWQIRYLTVSKETQRQQQNNQESNDVAAALCPRALLWLKQSGSSLRNRSLSSINGVGRGGMFFNTMKQVIAVESNEFYDRHLPKRLQKKFPEYAGVLLHYALADGTDRHVHFCFKTKQDAQSFITTMCIIQDVGKRGAMSKPVDEPIAATPTVTSETKSNDS